MVICFLSIQSRTWSHYWRGEPLNACLGVKRARELPSAWTPLGLDDFPTRAHTPFLNARTTAPLRSWRVFQASPPTVPLLSPCCSALSVRYTFNALLRAAFHMKWMTFVSSNSFVAFILHHPLNKKEQPRKRFLRIRLYPLRIILIIFLTRPKSVKSVLDKPSDLESVDSDVSSSADSTVEADASVYLLCASFGWFFLSLSSPGLAYCSKSLCFFGCFVCIFRWGINRIRWFGKNWKVQLRLLLRRIKVLGKEALLFREKPELLVREKGICWLGVCLCGRGFGEDGDYDETVDSADDLADETAEDPYSFLLILLAPAPHLASDFGKGTTITYARSSSMDSG